YKIEQIKNLINCINRESGLTIQFIENGDLFLTGFKASYGLFSGMPSLIALVGEKTDPELKQKIGYFGEFLVLECVSLELGTCWISGSYNREECLKSILIKDSEELVCIIAAGNVAENKTIKELFISQVGKGKQSFDELLAEKDSTPPLWVANGIEAARIAPSAVNGKPIVYQYINNQLSATIAKKNHDAEEIDLGISMAHFQLGALQGLKEGTWIKKENGYAFQ
ncbi:MAG: nitroreductase family protein, partial [Bacillota bacterium]